MVDVDAGELLADRADQQRRDNGRIHAAGQGKKDFLVADLGAEHLDALIDIGFCQRRGVDALHAFGSGFQCHSFILRFFYELTALL